MSDDLVRALRDSKGWPTLGHAAADCIREQRDLLDECERAMREVERLVLGANHSQTRYPYFLTMLAKLRAQEKADE